MGSFSVLHWAVVLGIGVLIFGTGSSTSAVISVASYATSS
jgi:Sec-independent protein translocase protein TatA